VEITQHPYFGLPTQSEAEAMGPDALGDLLRKREEAIRLEKIDPFHHGIEPPHWELADDTFAECDEMLILGGNRSGKSEFASKRCVKCLNDIPGANVLAMHTTASTSIEQQQAYVQKYIPSEWKSAKKGSVTNMTYSVKGGFTEGAAVAPNGSRIFFRNYSQNLEGGILEGSEWDFVWCDELVPELFIQSLRFRLTTRLRRPAPGYPDGYPWRGLMVTFTPVTGYTPTVRSYLQGARTIKSVDADPDLLPGEKVPVIQQPVKDNSKIIYFHSEWNKYNDYRALKRTLQNEPRTKILTRAYGLPTKVASAAFPRYGEDHVVGDDQIPEEGTNYHIVDPSNGRNWVQIWVRVTEDDRCYVYREWPCQHQPIPGVGEPGEWAVSGEKLDGDMGPAQQSFGFSLTRYKSEIERLEGDEQIAVRIMDSRFGAAPTPTKSGTTTLIEQMAELGLFFEPSCGAQIAEGTTLINDLLDYNHEEPMGPTNAPRMFVHESCKNTQFSLGTWTGRDGKRGASKDFVDVLRYFCLSGPTYFNSEAGILVSGKGY
jgi:hypothetical protein|tara:strand:- start:1121 stop:2746 length:1626 start_codon:yes stop_codon:yes gene_type:complete